MEAKKKKEDEDEINGKKREIVEWQTNFEKTKLYRRENASMHRKLYETGEQKIANKTESKTGPKMRNFHKSRKQFPHYSILWFSFLNPKPNHIAIIPHLLNSFSKMLPYTHMLTPLCGSCSHIRNLFSWNENLNLGGCVCAMFEHSLNVQHK